MRLSELSQHTGVSVPTIKYYLREGLLPPGEAVGARQSNYGDEHVRRLRLVRALLRVGGMSIAQVRDVLAVATDPAFGRHEQLGIAQYMLPPHVQPPADEPLWQEARTEVDALLTELGWRINSFSPSRNALTQAVVALRSLGYRSEIEYVRRYAEALYPIADAEYGFIHDEYADLDEAIEATVAYTLLYEPIMLAIRRLAHEDVSSRLHGRPPLEAASSPEGEDPPPEPAS